MKWFSGLEVQGLGVLRKWQAVLVLLNFLFIYIIGKLITHQGF